MGKLRARERKKCGRRPRPTGLPSVKETEEEMSVEAPPQPSIPAMDKLKSSSSSERVWACHSMLHFLDESVHQTRLLRAGLLDKLLPLLLDPEIEVCGAAANVLSKLSLGTGEAVKTQLTSHHCVAHLTALLHRTSTAAQLHHGHTHNEGVARQNGTTGAESEKSKEGVAMECEEVGGKKKKKAKKKSLQQKSGGRRETGAAEKSKALETLQLGLQLLANICELNPSVLELSFSEVPGQLVVMVLDLVLDLQACPNVSIAAAQVLLTVLEERVGVAGACLEKVPALIVLLSELTPDKSGEIWHGAASIASILYYLYSYGKEYLPASQELVQVVMTTYSSFLDIHPASNMSEQEGAHILEGQTVVMETIANMICTSEEDEEDEEFDEAEEEQAMGNGSEGMEVETGPEEVLDAKKDEVLRCLLQNGVHDKVLKMVEDLLECEHRGDDAGSVGVDLNGCRRSLLASCVRAFQSLLAHVSLSEWRGGSERLTSLWAALLEHCPGSCDPAALSSVMVTLLHVLARKNSLQCVSDSELDVMSKIGLTSDLTPVRRDMICMVGEVGKSRLQLLHQDGGSRDRLALVGGVLKESVAKDRSLSVICQAVDAIFDIFGEDSCPNELFSSLDLLPVLVECKATFNARYKVEKKHLHFQHSLVQMVRSNLPRFITYMKTRNSEL